MNNSDNFSNSDAPKGRTRFEYNQKNFILNSEKNLKLLRRQNHLRHLQIPEVEQLAGSTSDDFQKSNNFTSKLKNLFKSPVDIQSEYKTVGYRCGKELAYLIALEVGTNKNILAFYINNATEHEEFINKTNTLLLDRVFNKADNDKKEDTTINVKLLDGSNSLETDNLDNNKLNIILIPGNFKSLRDKPIISIINSLSPIQFPFPDIEIIKDRLLNARFDLFIVDKVIQLINLIYQTPTYRYPPNYNQILRLIKAIAINRNWSYGLSADENNPLKLGKFATSLLTKCNRDVILLHGLLTKNPGATHHYDLHGNSKHPVHLLEIEIARMLGGFLSG